MFKFTLVSAFMPVNYVDAAVFENGLLYGGVSV